MLTRFPVSICKAYRNLAAAGDREPLRGNNISEANKLKQKLNRLNGSITNKALNAHSRQPRFRQNNGIPLFFYVFSNSNHSCGQLSWSTMSDAMVDLKPKGGLKCLGQYRAICLALYWPSPSMVKEAMMNQRDRIKEILATYQKHGWQLRRLLLIPETRAEVLNNDEPIFGGARVIDANVDALWFSRPSVGKREAWELRLIAETPYALFQTFEADEMEEAHEEVRQEMVATMCEFTNRARERP